MDYQAIKERELINQQIKKGLDGRTQRWLCLKTSIAETEFSNKMKQRKSQWFTEGELKRIEKVLKIKLEK